VTFSADIFENLGPLPDEPVPLLADEPDCLVDVRHLADKALDAFDVPVVFLVENRCDID